MMADVTEREPMQVVRRVLAALELSVGSMLAVGRTLVDCAVLRPCPGVVSSARGTALPLQNTDTRRPKNMPE